MIITLLKKYSASLILLCTMYSPLSSATLINADYLNAGDNLAVLDQNTGLEWLDLTLTHGLSYSAALDFDSNYRYATNNEVETLFESVFGKPVFNAGGYAGSITGNLKDLAINFSNLFGSFNNRVSYGLYKDENSIIRMMGVYRVNPNLYGLDFSSNYNHLLNTGNISYSTYLVKKTPKPVVNQQGLLPTSNSPTQVPEPSSILIFLVALIALTSRQLKLR